MASTPAHPEESARPAMMTVNIKIEQPDIILVESLEQKKCDALVLNVSLDKFIVRKGIIILSRRYFVGAEILKDTLFLQEFSHPQPLPSK